MLIRNAFKAPLRRVFDYLPPNELRNPTERQKALLATICDGVEFFFAPSNLDAILKMVDGDYLYLVFGDEKELVCATEKSSYPDANEPKTWKYDTIA